ncbi:ubiquitin thioesterase trabid-like [Dermacentor silvarum]|uniref:ubiquitin thioesterase trabid-like n=1 Tax=Dermacentor silvarum TaxID=543639 RepID=UPI0018991B1D|nr:ubiquitin thioesterase trabid-like [Dermacentor silvarum]
MSRQGCKWTCQHCTYENWPKALRCVICQNLRPTLIEEEASSEERDIYKISPIVSPDPANPYQKWACGRCTYLNWPRSSKCTQCLQLRGSPSVVPASPPSSQPQQATTSTEVAHSSTDLRCKWTCHACTYENWPKSRKCVMCNVGRLKGDSPVGNRTPDPDDQRNNSAGVPSICTGGSNRLTGTTEIEVQVSADENPLGNNYLCSLRRQAREVDRLWLNACRAVVDGNPEPISRYLSSGGDPARQLTHAEAGLLSRTAKFDPGFTLAHMAIRQEREDILALLLSNSGMTHPVAKRVPSDVGRDAAADIRHHITASFKQKKGPFSCYFVTEFVTFALPTEIREFHPSVQKVLFDELLDQDVQKELEEDSAIINWSLELTETLGSRLYALWNRSAGNCLLDSALQATWGVFDRDNSLRQVLGDSLCEAASVLYPRWREAEALQARLLHFSLDEAQWQEDWTTLVSLAAQPGSALEQMHVFTLAHVLRRPIVVYGVKYVKSFRGEALGYARFEGIYIPLLWEPSFCWKSPIALGYTRGHFSALVPMEPEPEVICGAGANARDDLQVAFLPLMTADRQLLPLHFLTQGEVGREEEIIKQWLDCCVTEGGLLVAQQKVPRSPHLVLQMVDQWLEAYRKLSPHHRLTDSQSGYSSDGDSDQE